jgi:hypothetical protein
MELFQNPIFHCSIIPVSGLLTSVGKTYREPPISKESTKLVVKTSVNSKCNTVY